MEYGKHFLKYLARAALAFFAAGHAQAAGSDPVVTDRKVSVSAFVDAGQIVRGSLNDGQGTAETLDKAFVNRNGVALTYSGTLNGDLHMNIGVGGLFWKPIPETQDEQTKRILFGPGISEASAQFDFSPDLKLKFGFFGYKYNPDAVNLGEYLLRSEAYPNIIHTGSAGGWVWLNSNEYKSMGARLSWDLLGGALRQDFLLFSEFNETPIFDFSPAYVATLKAGRAVEIGGGISFHRWLPIHPSVTTPGGDRNTYVKYDAFPEVQNHAEVVVETVDGKIDTAFASWRGNAAFDQNAFLAQDPNRKAVKQVVMKQLGSARGTREGILFQMTQQLTYCPDQDENNCASNYLNGKGDKVLVTDEEGAVLPDAQGKDSVTAISPSESRKLTFKAIKVMARASLDLGEALGMDLQRTGPFKLFTEAAILGVQDQPLFYRNIRNRIPVMVGADIPTFGLLDLLSLQLEYFKNPFPDNNFKQFQDALPQPAYPSDNPAAYEQERREGAYSADDLKWSVFLRKSLFTGLDLYTQIANDHFRVQNVHAEPSYAPVTHGKSDWYYLFRFQWSM